MIAFNFALDLHNDMNVFWAVVRATKKIQSYNYGLAHPSAAPPPTFEDLMP